MFASDLKRKAAHSLWYRKYVGPTQEEKKKNETLNVACVVLFVHVDIAVPKLAREEKKYEAEKKSASFGIASRNIITQTKCAVWRVKREKNE